MDSIHNQKLAMRSKAKYLGVTISSDLYWSRYADSVTNKGNSTIGFLKRNARSARQAANFIKETAYRTFVWPTVEYATAPRALST